MTSANESGLMKVLKVVLTPFVFAVMFFFWKPAKFLSGKAYGGKWKDGLLAGLIGFALSCLAAISAANFGLAHGISFIWWGLASVLAFVYTGGIVWPAAFLGVFKPLWNFGDKLLDLTRKLAKNVTGPLFAGAASVARKVPGADALWAIVQDTPVVEGAKPRKRWAVNVCHGIVFIATLAFAAAVAYISYNYLLALVPAPLLSVYFVNQALAGLLALTAATFVMVPLYQLQDEGKEGYAVAVLSGVATWALATKTVLLTGVAGLGFYAAVAGIFALLFVYLVPGVIALASGGLVEAVLRGWKNLLEAVYDDEKNQDFRKFYHNLMNIVVALLSGAVTFYVANLVHLPEVLVWVAVVASVLYSYVDALREVANKSAGNPVIGLAVSVASGVAAWFWLPALVGITGGALVAAVIGVTAAVGFIVHPLVYLVVRALTAWAAAPVGTLLDSARVGAVNLFKKVRDAVRSMQKKAFDDTTPYSGMFGHLLNVAVIGVAIWQALPLAMGFLSFGFWINTILAVFFGINMFMLLGKLFHKWGAEALALGAGFVALLSSAQWAYGVSGGSIVATIIVAGTAAYVAGGLVAPAVYLVLRPIANLVLTGWLAPLLETCFNFMWDLFESFWRKFAGLYRAAAALVKPIFRFLAAIAAPIIKIVASLVGPLARAASSVWQSIAGMFGGRK